MKFLNGWKTYAGAVGMLLAAIFFANEGMQPYALALVSAALSATGLRHAFAKLVAFLDDINARLPPEEPKPPYEPPPAVTATLKPSVIPPSGHGTDWTVNPQ